jgi:hypothetical protein
MSVIQGDSPGNGDTRKKKKQKRRKKRKLLDTTLSNVQAIHMAQLKHG